MNPGGPYIGTKISLISKSEIRYEGILYSIDTKDAVVTLANGESFRQGIFGLNPEIRRLVNRIFTYLNSLYPPTLQSDRLGRKTGMLRKRFLQERKYTSILFFEGKT